MLKVVEIMIKIQKYLYRMNLINNKNKIYMIKKNKILEWRIKK